MFIERNGERIVIKPASMEDLGTPETEGRRHPLFVAFFTPNGDEVKRRVYVPKKKTDGSLFLVKQGGDFVETKELEGAVWCDSEGYAL